MLEWQHLYLWMHGIFLESIARKSSIFILKYSFVENLMIIWRLQFQVFCPWITQPNKLARSDETLPKSKDFNELVQQVHPTKEFLEGKIKVSANWFIYWTSPTLPFTLSTTDTNLRDFSNMRIKNHKYLNIWSSKNEFHKCGLWILKEIKDNANKVVRACDYP